MSRYRTLLRIHATLHSEKSAPKGVHSVAVMDLRGIETLTSAMPRKRAPKWRQTLASHVTSIES